MLEKLEAIYKRYKEIEEQMNNPAVVADMKKFIKLNKDYKELQQVVNAYKQYKNVLDNIHSTKELLKTEKDEEFKAEVKELADGILLTIGK